MGETRWLGWRGDLMVGLVAPAGVAIAAGALIASLATPQWRAGGLAYFLGYPKNVEVLALTGGVAVGAASVLCARWLPAYVVTLAIAAVGYGAGFFLSDGSASLAWLPVPLILVLLSAWLSLAWAPAGPRVGASVWQAGAAVLSVGLLAVVVFVLALPRVRIDAFHDGEVLATALDFLQGHAPFHAILLPHGLHDATVAALWSWLTGKIGSSPVALQQATDVALGVVALFLLAQRLCDHAPSSAAVCWLLGASTLALDGLVPHVGPHAGLSRLGQMVFVAISFSLAAHPRRCHVLLAGAAAAFGHLFRIEFSLYGTLAVLGVIGYRCLAEPQRAVARRVQALGSAVVWFGLGVVLPFSGLRLMVGWPDTVWFDEVSTLITFHRDATGKALPLPTVAISVAARSLPQFRPALLLPALVLLIASLAVARLSDRSAQPPLRRRVVFVVFLALLGFGLLRTASGRSDAGHVLAALGVVRFGVALLCVELLLMRGAAARRMVWLATAVSIGALVYHGASRIESQLALLGEHLTANAPVGPCRDTMFTATEAALPRNRDFIAATCDVEQMLRTHAVDRIVIDHAAPWYYARFQMPLPTRYYGLSRAYTPARQWELIRDLRAAQPGALLRVAGFEALVRYDVENPFNVPVVEAYLRARRRAAPTIETALGTLHLWQEPPVDLPAALPIAAESFRVHEAIYEPASGFVEICGTVAEDEQSAVTRLAVVPEADVTSETRMIAPGSRACGRVVDFVAPRVWLLTGRTLDWAAARLVLRGVPDERGADRQIVLPAPRRLPGRTGAEWGDLAAQVTAAAHLGRADRLAALEPSR
jgi:hypothetical protein